MKATRVREFPANYAAKVRTRIASRVTVTATGCWEWQGAKDSWGYGKFKISLDGSRWTTGSHRASYLAHRGPIEGDLVVDHLCRNPACCNPGHLEAVTNGENGRRGSHAGKKGRSGTRPGRTIHSCGRHGRDDGYLQTQADGYQRWVCRICRRARVARSRTRAGGPSAPGSTRQTCGGGSSKLCITMNPSRIHKNQGYGSIFAGNLSVTLAER